MRRAFALAVILTLTGVLPLIASARLCGGKSCCRKAAASCCATKCMKPSRQDSAPAQATTIVPPAVPQQTPAVVVAVREVDAAAVRPGLPPLPTQRRLATLSILLV